MNDGIVKMAPATRASPTLAAVRTMFCSWMVPRRAGRPEQGHGDDGRWNRGGDGLPSLHAEVGVRRSEDERQDEAQENGFDRQLRRLLRHIGDGTILASHRTKTGDRLQ
jgi:hypothetical protein